MPSIAYVGLGSNLGDRRATIEAAIARLRPRRVSRIVETEPWGRTDQPQFLNAVAEMDTELPPEPLWQSLREVEQEFGRVRAERWGPRTLDLDLLLYEDREVRTPELSIPHPRLAERRFILESLSELCPDRVVPGLGKTVQQLLKSLP